MIQPGIAPPWSVAVVFAALMAGERRRSPALAIEDQNGRQVARVHIARTRSWGPLVDLIVEVEDGISQQLRHVALGASMIATLELIGSGEGG